ncbi:MAG: glutamate racemase [Clostridiales bacterium]|nr:glutamate racemase [Clostridiales bacterium]
MPIGFFDSGVGGLSVLKSALEIMPNENYIYFGDSKNAPYGIKNVLEVKELTYKAVEFLLKKGAKALVIACNTATSAAVASLRLDYPDVPIVGIEPAVKPAVKLNTNKAIIIMATPMTIKEEKFNNLINRFKNEAKIIPMPCAGLMEFIEAGNFSSVELKEYIREKYKYYNSDEIGAIVLGCTHYPFIKDTIQEIVGDDIPIIDGGMGTCRELKRRLIEADLISNSNEKGKIDIYNSLPGDDIINISNKLLFS